ncbi:efflux RND transporter periplasmic adaptor subunit [Sphingomonas soli]|uniref:efflux RND transporter periplasmic adaptor subunit n=1 Tax=Sphingomonas soli TaxID=266127 RepID=UPI000830C025|nr:efflux RND transporter periplasmic adaptor subunit [Sphingomonas soli]
MRNLLGLIAFALTAAGCSGGGGSQPKGREAPLVSAAAVGSMRFVDRIDAVGTARANEQVTLAAPVTERITRLNFDDGAFVQRGQVIAVLAAGQENAQLAEAGARAREARQQLERLEQLKARGFATTSAVDAQTALAGQASAQAAQARASIGDRVIRAPFSGWVSLRNISAGAVVSAGTEIAQISDISRIKLDFAVPETLLARVQPGQAISARAAAYPDQPFRGTIATIDPVLSADTRAATVRAILANGDRRLKPGMLLTVSIESASRDSLAVPELAVVEEGEESFVYLLDGEKVKRTRVKPGIRQGGMVEILEGLSSGQRIVTEGVVKISDGQTVRLAGAPAAKPQAR